MAPRRVILHAGFHKTGTTSVQRFLLANGKHIWPRCALVLPGRLRKTAARMAVRYSRYGTKALLDQFAEDLHETLSAIDPGESRSILISDENLAGRMPGREGQLAYSATAELMARAHQVIRDVFGEDAAITTHFTLRDPNDWLLSTYKHNLRTSRLTLSEEEYTIAFSPASDLAAVAKTVEGDVHTSELADLTGPNGAAQPLLDLIDLPDHLRARIEPQPTQNAGPSNDLMKDLLSLNRSDLSDEALKAAKAALLGKAQSDDG